MSSRLRLTPRNSYSGQPFCTIPEAIWLRMSLPAAASTVAAFLNYVSTSAMNFILPFYPEAMVGRPVDMGFRIDRLQVRPDGVGVFIGR